MTVECFVSGVSDKQIRRLLRTVNYQIRKSKNTHYLDYKTCVMNYHEKIEASVTYNKRGRSGKFQVIPLTHNEMDDSGKSDSENDQIGDQVKFMRMHKLKQAGNTELNITQSSDHHDQVPASTKSSSTKSEAGKMSTLSPLASASASEAAQLGKQ
jgi:hypothetical protein